MILSGPFGDGLRLAFSNDVTLTSLLAVGVWAGRLGGEATWRMPVAALVGMAGGATLALVGIVPPYGAWIVPGVLIAIGLAVVADATVPLLAALLVALVAGVYQTAVVSTLSSLPILPLTGAGAGVLLQLAAGLGLVAMLYTALGIGAVRFLGFAAAALGALMVLGRF